MSPPRLLNNYHQHTEPNLSRRRPMTYLPTIPEEDIAVQNQIATARWLDYPLQRRRNRNRCWTEVDFGLYLPLLEETAKEPPPPRAPRTIVRDC